MGRQAAASLALRRHFGTVDTSSSDTHDDFKPKYKVEPVNDVNELIKKDVTTNSVFLYMKGVPAAPQCGFSDLAVKVLTAYGAWLHAWGEDGPCMKAAWHGLSERVCCPRTTGRRGQVWLPQRAGGPSSA